MFNKKKLNKAKSVAPSTTGYLSRGFTKTVNSFSSLVAIRLKTFS